ncbi:helix-turn-helix domain-containing protein [Nocardia farcinica]|uniref:helix-turn-helix domain-containing protein n=2 Tax=Nocardia farcinica TaxID=37329 RepID=UPI001894263E|nr:helix-turn-helix transcriptional regulator [Nocardia farcinica]MBF6230037.1 helix-turn-helix transcriptional regulator [Nocardia farcinica]MBF6440798.1 helix-turn-helix transcriptional regulator [Nocardia farcinica]
MDSPDAIVGAQLRAARTAAGMSLDALASLIPYSKSALCYYETGRRKPTTDVIAWYERCFGGTHDPTVMLLSLGKADVERRSFLRAGYSAAVSASVLNTGRTGSPVPDSRVAAGTRHVGRADVTAVHDVIALFSRIDQRHGGGHGRSAVVQYLTTDVTSYLCGAFAEESVRHEMFSAAAELAYLAGWMSFDNGEHAAAQRYFVAATKLATEADDAPLTGHILRAMAHQAIDLGDPRSGLALAEASVDGSRYRGACPRERALLTVVHAKALSAAGRPRESAKALLRAERDLAAACGSDAEPARVFFFSEASLAHETACALRDSGDLDGAAAQFQLSARKRQADMFTRTHAVTLGYLGTVQARSGDLDLACATWSSALDAMGGVRSGRTRTVARDIRAVLEPHRDIPYMRAIDDRAAQCLAASTA